MDYNNSYANDQKYKQWHHDESAYIIDIERFQMTSRRP